MNPELTLYYTVIAPAVLAVMVVIMFWIVKHDEKRAHEKRGDPSKRKTRDHSKT
jgi:uncharacterized membrane protein